MKNWHGFLTKGDWVIVFIIISLAAVTSLPYFLTVKKQLLEVIIVSDEKIVYEQTFDSTSEDFTREFNCATGPITFSFEKDKGVRVLHASCPDQLCVHTGYIKESGQMLVCLPGKIYAQIRSLDAKGDELDATVR